MSIHGYLTCHDCRQLMWLHDEFNRADDVGTECPVDVQAHQTDRVAIVLKLLGHLSDRDRHVIVRRFGVDGKAPETLAAIGLRYGVTNKRIQQLEARAIKRLRAKATAQGITGE